MIRRWCIVAMVAVCALCGSARAAVYATFRYDTWTFAPIVHNNAIVGFLAWADPTSLTGSNIPIIYYKRETLSTWSMWGWNTYDLGAATRYLHVTLADESLFQYDPDLVSVETATTTSECPKQLEDGVYVDDPVHALIDAAVDPVGLVSVLGDVGWEVAPGLSELSVTTPVTCTPTSMPVNPVNALLTERTRDMEIAIWGFSNMVLPCTFWPCAGCVTVYGAMVPDANASWVFKSSHVVEGTTSTICFYEISATQTWTRSGHSTFLCLNCSGSGTRVTHIRSSVVVPVGQSCHPPS